MYYQERGRKIFYLTQANMWPACSWHLKMWPVEIKI